MLLVIALLSIGGLVALARIPRALFPQTDFPRIIIVAENGVAPAQQTLVSVTKPIEEAMSGIPGISRIKSTTARGSTEIDLFFDWRTDIVQTLQLVQTRVSQLASKLPPGATIERTERLTFAVFPIIGYSITSPVRDPGTLRNLAEVTLRPPIARIDGVASVEVLGGQLREYHVLIDRSRLEARGVSLQQVSDAVRGSNVINSPGLINENHQLELALVSGQATTLDDLAAIVVTTVNNVPVRVGDVATVEPGLEPRFTIVTADGRPAVLLNVLRQPTANIVAVADGVKAELADASQAAAARRRDQAVLRPVAARQQFGRRRCATPSSSASFCPSRFSTASCATGGRRSWPRSSFRSRCSSRSWRCGSSD